MDRYFDLVDNNGFHVVKDVAFPSLAQAYESYFKLHPEGLPKGWRIVDTSKPIIEEYVSSIKKLKPSFRKSDIKIYYDDVLFSRPDLYLVVPFSYKGKNYVYRETISTGKSWIEKAPKRPKEGVDIKMADKAQSLVNDLKNYYKEGDIPSAYSCWCKIYDLFEPKEYMTWPEREALFKEQQKYISQISDEAVFTITDYGREKYYWEQGYYDGDRRESMRVGIVYNYKGLSENNYIFTKDDAVKNITSWLCEDECKRIIDKLEECGFAAGEISSNKTYEFYDLSDDEKLHNFLNGDYNNSALDACLRNYNDLLSIENNYKLYSDWYWQLEAVSEEYKDTLGQYVGVAHSFPDFEEFKKIVSKKEISLDSVINEAVNAAKNTSVPTTEKFDGIKGYE